MGAGHTCHVNPQLTGWEATALMKFMKARNRGVPCSNFEQKAGGFHVVSHRNSQSSTRVRRAKQL